MEQLTAVLMATALLGSAVVAGVFFAFSSFVMKALARLPSAVGIAAMQSINVVVINPLFLGTFIGTAVLSLAAIVVVIFTWGHDGAPFHLSGALLYLIGTFLVTGLGNVPLNDRLASVSPDDPLAASEWARYVTRWSAWNHLRTIAASAAALSHCLGLLA